MQNIWNKTNQSSKFEQNQEFLISNSGSFNSGKIKTN